jgi:coenzyme F420-0:L-glutamate ligase/coenzyme F420-1:gamma-L-glutamate ligase
VLRKSRRFDRAPPSRIVGAQAGIDQSNIEHGDGKQPLLPANPDASARRSVNSRGRTVCARCDRQRQREPALAARHDRRRNRQRGIPFDDRRGGHDIYGRELKVTMVNRADSIATAATLVMGETTEKTPVALVRGFPAEDSGQTARDIIRPLEEDMFR